MDSQLWLVPVFFVFTFAIFLFMFYIFLFYTEWNKPETKMLLMLDENEQRYLNTVHRSVFRRIIRDVLVMSLISTSSFYVLALVVTTDSEIGKGLGTVMVSQILIVMFLVVIYEIYLISKFYPLPTYQVVQLLHSQGYDTDALVNDINIDGLKVQFSHKNRVERYIIAASLFKQRTGFPMQYLLGVDPNSLQSVNEEAKLPSRDVILSDPDPFSELTPPMKTHLFSDLVMTRLYPSSPFSLSTIPLMLLILAPLLLGYLISNNPLLEFARFGVVVFELDLTSWILMFIFFLMIIYVGIKESKHKNIDVHDLRKILESEGIGTQALSPQQVTVQVLDLIDSKLPSVDIEEYVKIKYI